MQFKLDIVEKTINRARAANIPQVYHVPQVGRHFLELTPATEKKSNPQKMCCLHKKESKKGVKVSVQELRIPSWIVSNTLFGKIHSFLLDFIWA